MGRGDIKSKRVKIANKSYGVRRRKNRKVVASTLKKKTTKKEK
ncbi:30S ribosomal protein THX [Maribacter sp. 2308TA10-17]